MIVLDTSAAIELVLGLPLSSQVQKHLDRVEWHIAAPQLSIIEVLQVLRRRVSAGYNTVGEANEARQLIRDLNIRYYPHEPLAERVWELRDSMSAYDASFVALAEGTGHSLLTSDARLANAHGHAARITLVN